VAQQCSKAREGAAEYVIKGETQPMWQWPTHRMENCGGCFEAFNEKRDFSHCSTRGPEAKGVQIFPSP